MSIVDNGTPRSYKEAMRSSEADQWKKATDDEYTAIVNNNTYRLVPLPKDRKSVTTKWIYKIKYNADGTVDCYKACWVARDFTQCKGIDYFETTSPVVRMENLRLATGHAMLHCLNIQVVDVKNVFLQAETKEEEMILVTQPEGYVDSDHPNWVCLLLKSLYKIKQAPRVWKKTLYKFLIESNFNQSDADPCAYTRLNKRVERSRWNLCRYSGITLVFHFRVNNLL